MRFPLSTIADFSIILMSTRSRLLEAAASVVVAWSVMHTIGTAQDRPLAMVRPACGKVCKLVCETRKLVDVGYGNECKAICLPAPSRPGCKHCMTVCGECKTNDPCSNCETTAPKFEFCWRDWFACGCTTPRNIKVLTKYQAEKKICWYHWEVVDASCCDCISAGDNTSDGGEIVQSPRTRALFKPAPENAQLGDTMSISNEDWVQLAALLAPDPHDSTDAVAGGAPPAGAAKEPAEKSELDLPALKETAATMAGRIQNVFTK